MARGGSPPPRVSFNFVIQCIISTVVVAFEINYLILYAEFLTIFGQSDTFAAYNS